MNKTFYFTTGITLLCFFGISYGQYFNQPESIVYEELNDRYFISNNGSGKIVQLTPNDTSVTDFEGNLGMAIVDKILYAVKGLKTIRGYNLITNENIMDLEITEASLLNDITMDLSGFLYVTDFNGHKIYKVNMQTDQYTSFVSSSLANPNGILFDEENNRLIICESFSNKIKAINLMDSTVTTIISNGFPSMDGLSRDGLGNIYISTWQTNSVYRYDKSFSNPPELISSGHDGPADIYFNQNKNILCVPNYNSNSIELISIPVSGINKKKNGTPNEYQLFQNYPNPFNPLTTISYRLVNSGLITLNIYDVLGKKIQILVNEFQNAGMYAINFDASQFSGGTYFCRLCVGDPSADSGQNYVVTKKMVPIR